MGTTRVGSRCDVRLYIDVLQPGTMAKRRPDEGTGTMAGRLPTELYIHPRPGGIELVEQICTQATGQLAPDVVAVAVAPSNVLQASDLLFGTGIGVVGTIDDPSSGLIDQARHSVARGATEIALPPMVLDQASTLTRLRSRLGPNTPVTVGMDDGPGGLDLNAATQALDLGADYVSFSPQLGSPTARQDMARLIALAHEIGLGGVKISTAEPSHATWLQTETLAPMVARLCLPST